MHHNISCNSGTMQILSVQRVPNIREESYILAAKITPKNGQKSSVAEYKATKIPSDGGSFWQVTVYIEGSIYSEDRPSLQNYVVQKPSLSGIRKMLEKIKINFSEFFNGLNEGLDMNEHTDKWSQMIKKDFKNREVGVTFLRRNARDIEVGTEACDDNNIVLTPPSYDSHERDIKV